MQLVGLPVEDATKLLLVAEVYNHKVSAVGRHVSAFVLYQDVTPADVRVHGHCIFCAAIVGTARRIKSNR